MTTDELLQVLEQNPDHKLLVNSKAEIEAVKIEGENTINLIAW